MSETWSTTVDDLMGVFRDALIALIPVLDRAKIASFGPTVYDDWDNIAQALYENIALWSIQCSSAVGEGNTLSVPRYGVEHSHYSDVSFIEVVADPVGASLHLAFVGFGTGDSPFDVVGACAVDNEGTKVNADTEPLPIGSCRFRFQHRTSSGLRTLDGLTVLL